MKTLIYFILDTVLILWLLMWCVGCTITRTYHVNIIASPDTALIITPSVERHYDGEAKAQIIP